MNTSPFAATIGLDWADQKHDLWLRPGDGGKAEHIRVEQTPEALHLWVAKLRQRFRTGLIAVAVETSRGPIITALLTYEFFQIFAVNPKALKDYRGAFSVSGAKDDRTDAQLLEEFVRLHHSKLKAFKPDTQITRQLAGMVENRRQFVDERTALINRLHAKLKTYYPLAEKLIGKELNTVMAAEFLLLWPDLESLQKTREQKLRAFFYKHNSRSETKMETRLAAISSAQPLTRDQAIIAPGRQMVLGIASMLKSLHRTIEEADQAIEQLMDQHPDAPIFRSLPAAGPALAPRLLVAFGTDRTRFQSAGEVAQLYGIAPVVVQSGESRTVHIRRRCPKFGRQTFHENANCVAKNEPWAKAYYKSQRQRHDDKHHQACRSLAFKLIRIYFACWKNRTEYRTQTYLEALNKNGSPLTSQLKKIACEQKP